MINHPAQDAREVKTFRQNLLLIVAIIISIFLVAFLLSIQFAYPRLQKEHAGRLAAQGDFPAALALYEKYGEAAGSQEGQIAASLDYAASLFRQGQFDQADTLLAALDRDERYRPYHDHLMYWRGRCAEENGRYRSAAGYFQRCLHYVASTEKQTGAARYLEVSMLLAKEYEAEGKTLQAYHLYDSLSGDVPEAAAKADAKKTEMRASFLLLQKQFEQAVEDHRFSEATDALLWIGQANEVYASYFSDYLVTCNDFDQMTFDVIRSEKDAQIQTWFDQYDLALAEQNTQAALTAIQEIDRLNAACQDETGSFLVSADELQQKHDAAAKQVLGANLIDQLNTDRVGTVSLKLGRTPDEGSKTKLVPIGSDFGLSIINIKTEQTLQVKWYRREIPYLESDLTETLVLVSREMIWQPGISWYAWAEATGEKTGFVPGYYAVDLLAKNDDGEEERISRTYFQILDANQTAP